MTVQSVKAVFLKATTAALVVGALFVAGPQAQAQQFAVGVQFGAPAYGYAYGPGPGYYDHLRWEREQAIARRDGWIRQEEWRRHEDWRYRRDLNGYPPRAVPYGGWR